MKFKKIVSIGDSWTYGDELLPINRERQCYTGLLGRHFNAEAINLGDCGSSIISARNIFSRYLTYFDPADTLFLIGLTERNRYSWMRKEVTMGPEYDHDLERDNHQHSTFIRDEAVTVGPGWEELYKSHLVMHQSKYSEMTEYLNTVLFFDGIASRLNLPLVQFRLFGPGELADPEPVQELIHSCPTYIFKDQSLNDFVTGHKFNNGGGHPTAEGHKIITNKLILEIEKLNDN